MAEKTSDDIFKLIKDENVEYVDIRFCDLPGVVQHFSIPASAFDASVFEDGLAFDGSSVRGFQSIHESDMMLLPDPDTARIDPFRAAKTLNLNFFVHDPFTREAYSRDPRNVARKAENYLASTGIADTCYFGAEAEFYAGWLALNRLKSPALAEGHFAALAGIGSSPITRGRALYWQGRTAEAAGDPVAAAGFYGDGARFWTTFYGQLAAEKAGVRTLALGKDPEISAGHRARFEANELVRAARLLNAAGATDLFNAFVLYMDDVLDTAEDQALLVDLALSTGNQDLAMRAARTAATRGFILPERGYPLVAPPAVTSSAEPAFSLSIARQESNFDPNARSGVGARGMMQLMPATARLTARKMGEPFAEGRLTEAAYNMRLGATYLGDMVDSFSGSYAMAAAAYNAGPGRPRDWVSFCGDPRTGSTDPLDFIECIPFSETRNYVMRVLENMTVYRAKMAGGSAPITLSADLRRGSYSYTASTGQAVAASNP